MTFWTILVIFGLAVLLVCFPTVRCAICHPFLCVRYGATDFWYYMSRKQWHSAPYGQISCYIADSSTSFGCGKTLSATDCIVSLFRQYDGKMVWCSQRKKFVTQRIKIISNVDFLTIPYERLVSLSQFVQWTDMVWEHDLAHDTFTVTYVVIDEASSQLNSRSFKSNFDAYFISRLLTSRHVHASIILTSQRAGMVDKLMRDCCHLYIGCNKVWRFQCLNYYDAYEIENAQTPALVAPIRRTCWFVTDSAFSNYDTYASVQALKKSCQEGDMLSEEEILALQVGTPANMDVVQKPSRKWLHNQKKRTKR